jgi:hypothetical protein
VEAWAIAGAGLLVLAPLAACSSGGCDDPGREPEVLTRPEVRPVDEGAANLLVDLSGALSEPLRVTVTFDDDLALDVEVPGTPADCASQPVSRYGYRVDPGTVTVSVGTGDGQQESVAVTASDVPRWVVVSLQDGFPLEAAVWDERPAYG